jgi:hypothetical protein
MEAEGWQEQLQNTAALPQDVDMTDAQLLAPADGAGGDGNLHEVDRDADSRETAATYREHQGPERNVSCPSSSRGS